MSQGIFYLSENDISNSSLINENIERALSLRKPYEVPELEMEEENYGRE